MKIVTEEFETLFKDYPLYSQEHESDPLVVAKLFDPCGSATWFLLEFDPVSKRHGDLSSLYPFLIQICG